MLGPEGAAERARTWLEAALPARLRALEARLGLPAGRLLDPALIAATDKTRLALEEWPAVFVVVEDTRGLELLDTGDAGELYRVRYAARLFAWVRGNGWDDVDLARKRYTLALREVALTNKTLSAWRAPADDAPAGLAVDPASLRESLSPELTDEAGRTIGAAMLELDLLVDELLDTPTVAPVDTVTVDTAALPAHPAL